MVTPVVPTPSALPIRRYAWTAFFFCTIMAGYWSIVYSNSFAMIAGYSLLWLLGVGSIVVVARRSQARIRVLKRVQDAQQESSALYRGVYENAPLAFAIWDRDCCLVDWNRRAESIFGWTRDEVLGRNFLELLVPAAARPAAAQVVERLLKAESPGPFTSENVTKDGKAAICEWNFALRLDANGKVVGVTALALDVTGRKKVEADHLSLQERFLQKQKMESVGRLAGGVAHDFNNLLSVIMGYAELILTDHSLPERNIRESVLEIQRAGERAKSLTRQLLAFGRKQVLELKPVDLNGIVAGFEKLLQRLIGENITIVTFLDPAMGTVMADPTQIEQILMNLTINSRDAMPGGGTLMIRTGAVDVDEMRAIGLGNVAPGRYAMLAVSDTGCGMDQATLDRVFEPFFTTKEEGKGTGLGLSMVYGIVKQHGGEIWICSDPSFGTTFQIYLPMAPSGTQVDMIPSFQPSLSGGSETILVAEDDPSLRDLACKILAGYGYQVLEARDVLDAVRIAAGKRDAIDLLLTDVVMPEMNGRQLGERIREHCPRIQVVYMSGYAQDAIIHQGVLEEGIPFIQKPFTSMVLAQKIRSALDVPNRVLSK